MLYLYTPQGIEIIHNSATSYRIEDGCIKLIREDGDKTYWAGCVPLQTIVSFTRLTVTVPKETTNDEAALDWVLSRIQVMQAPGYKLRKLKKMMSGYRVSKQQFITNK